MISFQNVPSCFFAYFVVISTCSYLQSVGLLLCFLISLSKAIFIPYRGAIRANTESYPVSMNTYPIQLFCLTCIALYKRHNWL